MTMQRRAFATGAFATGATALAVSPALVGNQALVGRQALAASPVLAAPPDLKFQVFRNGSGIGEHAIAFRQEGAVLIASIAVDIAVRLGPIVIYRYGLTARETWRDGQFANLDCQVADNGTRRLVKAARTAAGVTVEVDGKALATLPAGTLPLTHWNQQCMERPLFNPDDGLAIASRVVPRGEEMVALAGGGQTRASRYSLVGKVELDDWYDTARNWASLRSPGSDGSQISYTRV